MNRCAWATADPLYIDYHDREWGVPARDDRILFEFLVLEGAQAGLSWITILKKRSAYREAFSEFDPQAVAAFTEERTAALLEHPGIVRNRAKIRSAVQNARAFLRIQEEFGSFDAYIWRYVGGKPEIHHFAAQAEVPAATPLSDAVSRDLKRRGFSFVGSTICYSFLQATGLVMDHTTDCFRHAQLAAGNRFLVKRGPHSTDSLPRQTFRCGIGISRVRSYNGNNKLTGLYK
jgi:DNA-3-methyladenine glycosylase I